MSFFHHHDTLPSEAARRDGGTIMKTATITKWLGAIGGLVILSAATAWACTATHTGATWFCTGSTGCALGFRYTGDLDNDNSYSQVIGSGAVANTTYDLWYESGHSQGTDCAENATGSFGTLTTNSSGVGVKALSLGSISLGDYTACPAIENQFVDGTAHQNFTIVD